MIPRGAAGDGRTRALLAVVAGARTWTDIVEATGMAKTRVHVHLTRLQRDGLVAWEPHRQGTLRPLVRRVA